MKKIYKKIPKFKNEDDERKFWDKNSSVDYVDWSKAKTITFPNLAPSTETISLRLPASLLNKIKVEANKIDVPYQSYIKMIVSGVLNDKP